MLLQDISKEEKETIAAPLLEHESASSGNERLELTHLIDMGVLLNPYGKMISFSF